MSSGVEFEEDNFGRKPTYPSQGANSFSGSYGYQYSADSSSVQQKGMVGWLIRHGIVKSATGANVILFGVVLLNILITILILVYLL